MATTKTSSTKNTKTKPSKKPATKPAGASVKPKSVKTTSVKSTSTTKTVTAQNKPQKKNNRVMEIIFGVIIIVIAVALIAWAIICICFGNCGEDIVQIDAGNGKQVSATYVEIPQYKLNVLIPTDFKKLSESELDKKYTDGDSIDVAYLASDESAALAFTQADTKFTNDDVKTFINALKAAASASNAKSIETNFYEESGYSVGTIKFYDASEKVYPYQYAAVFSYDDKVTLMTFEYTAAAKDQWNKVSDTIMNSLKFNQSK